MEKSSSAEDGEYNKPKSGEVLDLTSSELSLNIALLDKLVSIDSTYPNEHEIGDFLFDYLQQLGFEVQKQYLNPKFCEDENDKTRFNVLAEKGEGEKSILFYAHMDTVPVHDEKLWKTDPLKFVKDQNDENIYRGLGTVDMKGGLFAILEAIKDFQPKGYKLKVVFGSDEECRSKGSHTLVNANYLDDVELCIVPELGDERQVEPNKQNIIVGRRGRFVIKIEVPGKSCHGANAPALGINAITQGSVIAQEIDNKYQITKTHERMPDGNQFVKHFNSSVSSLSVPDSAVLYVDRHILPGETQESVLGEIHAIIDTLYSEGKIKDIEGQKVKISFYDRPTPAGLAYETDADNHYVKVLIDAVKSIYGERYKYSYGLSVADENVFASAKKGLPVVTLGPAGGNEHGANEWVDIKSVEKLVGIYRNLLEKLNNIE